MPAKNEKEFIKMKKTLSVTLALLLSVTAALTPVAAKAGANLLLIPKTSESGKIPTEPSTEEPTKEPVVIEKLTVSGKELATDEKTAPFIQNETVMVPLRLIAEALSYGIGYDAETREITVEDTYVQRARLTNGSCDVVFEGKLKVIDMSRSITLAEKVTVKNGVTFVPSEFFAEFFNDITLEGGVLDISPQTSELC